MQDESETTDDKNRSSKVEQNVAQEKQDIVKV